MRKDNCSVNYIGKFIKAVCEHKTVRIYSKDNNINRVYIYDSKYNVYHELDFTFGCVKLNDFIGYWANSIYDNIFKYEIIGE